MKSVARDSWHLKPILKYLQNLQNISFPIHDNSRRIGGSRQIYKFLESVISDHSLK